MERPVYWSECGGGCRLRRGGRRLPACENEDQNQNQKGNVCQVAQCREHEAADQGPTGATTPFNPSFVNHGKLKDTGPTSRAMAVANREMRVRIEKVSAKIVTMRRTRGKEGMAAGGSSEGRKGVDSSSAGSSESLAGGCGGGGDGSRSSEDPDML